MTALVVITVQELKILMVSAATFSPDKLGIIR